MCLRARLGTLLACVVAPLSGCDSRQPESSPAKTIKVVAAARKIRVAPPRITLAPVASAPQSLPAVPGSLADMRPRKAFTDPPLPPELRDDGDLRPLPPRPPR